MATDQDLSAMPTSKFLSYLHRADVELWAEGDRLRFSAPRGALNPALKAELARRKDEVLRFLHRTTVAAQAEAPPIAPAERTGPLPLSFAQERLWFFDQLEPGSLVYNIFQAVRLTGPLDLGVLARSFGEVVRRHASLRTTFAAGGGTPVQVIAPALDLPLPIVDLVALPGHPREPEARRWLDAVPRRPFDLTRGPLLRTAVLRLGAAEHVVLFTIHHIISDGWSAGILIRELLALYGALSRGEASPLPELPLQYTDFAAWQRQWLQGPVLAEQLGYWKEQLDGAPHVLELPADHPRSDLTGNAGGKLTERLPGPLAAELRALCQRTGVTFYMACLATLGALLHRHTGQDDLLIGSPIANRNRAEIEGLIGFFVNTLVLRTRLRGETTFLEALEQVRDTTVAAYSHQDLPFDLLVAELRPERSRSHTPLFQILFVFQNAPRPALEMGGLRSEVLQRDSGTELFDLTLNVWEMPDGIEVSWRYRRGLFEPSTIRRLASRFETLLTAMTGDPGRAVEAVPLWTESESHQVLVEWNDTAAGAAGETCLHELFETQAQRTPDVVAVTGEGGSLTYRELDDQANRWARHLQSLSVTTDTLVGVALERSLDMLVGLLAVLKAGGAYVPLDPAYPEARLAAMLQDAGAPVVLVHAPTRERIAALAGGSRVVCLDADRAAADRRLAVPPPATHRALPDSLAYVIYTSGSTGRPKGVAVRHGGAAALVRWALKAFTDAECAGMLASTSVSFDVSVFELFTPLARGGTAVLVDNALGLAGLPGAGRVTLVSTPPSVMAELLRLRALPGSVRTVALAGEALPGSLAADLHGQIAVERVCNIYGPTEATVYATFEPVPPDDLQAPAIGRPISGTRTYVLDRAARPVPLGVRGELCLGGAGLARGYLRRPDLTAERFVPDAVSGRSGSHLYRTGDLVRLRADGRIEYLGRLDQQVKVRGFRVELGEIEEALRRQPGVRDAAVVVRGASLVACVVSAPPDGEPPLPASALRGALRRALPDYMVPSAVLFFEALPLTATGKVDRRALAGAVAADRPQPALHGLGSGGDPVEEVLAGIWTEVLGTDRFGAGDSFFDVGGHSLLATQVLSRVRQSLDVELSLHRFFDAATLSGLAEAVRAARSETQGEAPPPIVPVPRNTLELPLSFAQQRLWFLDQLTPGSPVYNMPAAVSVTGALDPGLLERVFNEVVRRHEALRTTFRVMDGRPVQVPARHRDRPLSLVDLSALPVTTATAEARRLAAGEARTPFNLVTGPLIRLTLLRLAGDEHVLLLTLHHIVSDGWSMGVFLGELAALLEVFSRGEPSPLPELAIQYADYAWWQRQWLSGPALDAKLAFWRRQLAGAPPHLDLPTDRPRQAVETFRGDLRPFSIPAELSRSLVGLSRRQGGTLFMTLLAGFYALLNRYTGREDIVVGSPSAGRNRREIEGLIGFFVNNLVLRADLSGDPAFQDLFARVRRTTLDAYAHQDLPFERLVEELQPERDLSTTPLFQVMIALQNTPRTALRLPGTTLRSLPGSGGTARFELSLSLQETDGVLAGALEYKTDLFHAATIARFLSHFERLLEGVAADPGRRLSELPLLSPAELQQTLLEWNATAVPPPAAVCVPQRVEAWAASAPEATAVVAADGRRLSYGELNARANQLAWVLRSRGVGPETQVGVWMERSPEEVTALLAVLKAGGSYLPLDPATPRERVALVLADADAVLLLTESALAGDPNDLGVLVLALDAEREAVARQPRHDPPAAALPGNLAYTIYTSGSTGRPKGVQVEHRSLLRLIDWHGPAFGISPGDRATRLSGLAFDASVWELWPYLAAGASVHVPPEEARISPPALRDWLIAEGITISFVPTPVTEALLALDWPDDAPLRYLLTGGDRLHRHAPAPLPFTLVNDYGPTENTVVATSGPVPDTADERTPSIARPIAGVRVYVFHRDLTPVPTGAPGELCLGGSGLARGYLGQPAMTATSFVPAPLGGEPGGRLYRTGDLVRHRPDGEIEFLSRLDHQVKIRGLRIELGEIEETLRQVPGLGEVAVVVQQGPAGPHLAAFYTSPRSVPDPELRQLPERTLPQYMVPSTFTWLDALPLTLNGKVDRKALERYDTGRQEAQAGLAPRNRLELELVEIWRGLLGIESISVTDDFFKLGGHSLLAVHLTALIRERLGRELPVTALFQTPTIEELAAVLQQEGTGCESPVLVPLRRQGAKAPFFCVHGAGGDVFRFVELARRLGELDRERPFHALQASGWTGEGEPLDSVEAMAACYLAAVRRAQPGGPYHLGGYSMGGLVAYEMARRLREQGEEVAFLGMIDALSDARGQAEAFERTGLPTLLAWELGIPLAPEDLAGLGHEEQLAFVLGRGRQAGKVPAGLGEADLGRYVRILETTVTATRRFRAERTYPGRITVFRGESRAGREPDMGWEAIAAGGVEVYALTGDHRTLFAPPHVEPLAALLNDCLGRAVR